ncbi:MAG: transcription termination/antitermination protein NusG [Acidimicrobiia bacterium]
MTTNFTDHTTTEPSDDAEPEAPTEEVEPQAPEAADEAGLEDRVGALLENARGDHLIEEADQAQAEAAAQAAARAAEAAADAVVADAAVAEAPAATLDASAELVDVVEIDDGEGDESDVPAAPAEPSPYDRPGGWYVVHTYAGYENKVKSNLANRIRSMHVEERIFEVIIPMEDVIEFKGGQRRVVQKKVFPGYLLVRMDLDDDSWYVVRNTPGVTGFVGPSGSKPTPLSRKEVEDILGVEKLDGTPAVEKKVRPRVEFEEGEQVRVVTGPFADFNGAIAEIDVDRSKLKVLVNIFGRETPVELEFGQVAKL